MSLTMESIENYDYDAGRHPIATNQIASLHGIVRDSFMTFYDGCLYVGCFTKYTDSAIARYAVDDQGNLINTMDEGLGMNFGMAVPLIIPPFPNRHREWLFITTSFFCLIPLEFCLPEWYFMRNPIKGFM